MSESGHSVEVSVVIPVWNREALVGQALASVLQQDDAPPFEVVVVDDGSTDGTARVVEAVEDGRVRLIRQDNAGVAAARNNGVRQARGTWIYFLDSDDVSMPGSLTRLHEATKQQPEPDVVYGEYAMVLEDGTVLPHEKAVRAEGDRPVDAAFRECALAMGSGLVRRRSILQAGLFDTSFTHSEDYLFWATLAAETRWRYVPGRMVECRQFGQRASADRVGHILAHYRAQKKLMKLYRRRGVELDETTRREAVDEFLAFHGRKLYWQRRGGPLSRLLWTAAWRNPTQWKLWLYWLASLLPKRVFVKLDHAGDRRH